MFEKLKRIFSRKEESPETVITEWVLIELKKPDGTPYYVREMMKTEGQPMRITINSRSGHSVFFEIKTVPMLKDNYEALLGVQGNLQMDVNE